MTLDRKDFDLLSPEALLLEPRKYFYYNTAGGFVGPGTPTFSTES